MHIGDIVEIGERVIETPKIEPQRREPAQPAPEPKRRERVKEPA